VKDTPAPESGATTRFAATVSYDGTDFSGSQRQPGLRTVQEELERAAAALFGQPTRVAMAGRTDTGVHAVGQTRLDAATVGRALNAHLPDDVAVRDVRAAPVGFDPRRDARRRTYRYTIFRGASRQPLLRQRAWHVPAAPGDDSRGDPGLALDAMRAAAHALTGRRDFAAAGGPIEDHRTTVRTVFDTSLETGCESAGALLLFTITADAFLPQMVRRLTGALVNVGRGLLTGEDLMATIATARTATLGPVAPPQGLCLLRVEYDEGYRP